MKRSWKSGVGNPGDGWHFDKGLSMGYKNESRANCELFSMTCLPLFLTWALKGRNFLGSSYFFPL